MESTQFLAKIVLRHISLTIQTSVFTYLTKQIDYDNTNILLVS